MTTSPKLYYTISGNGPCIVLLHGLMEDIHVWEHISKQLSEYFCVLCIDLPGHGKTVVDAEIYTMDFMAGCVNKVLVENNIKKCVMVGHSMGGYVMTCFAKQFPEKLCGICYLNSHVLSDTDEAKQNRDRAIALIQADKLGYIANFMSNHFTEENRITYKNDISILTEHAKSMNPNAIIATQRGIKEKNSGLSVLMEAKFPVLFIAGKKDQTIPIDKIMAQALIPQHSELLILGNTAHMTMIEARQKTTDMIESFADRCFSY